MFIVSIVLGLGSGMFVVSILFDILFFDIPLTLKLRKTNFINSSSIISGSLFSLVIWSIILFLICYLYIKYFPPEISQFIISLLLASVWIIAKKKKRLLTELYFKKHINNVAPPLKIVLYNKDGFDFEGVKNYLNSYLQFDDKQF